MNVVSTSSRAWIFASLLCAPLSAQVTQRVSVAFDGAQANGWSELPSMSADGRFVAFFSKASNLVPGDTNGWGDVFVRDRARGFTERIDLDSAGHESAYGAGGGSISADGRFVAFVGFSDLVSGDTNGVPDIFVRDRATGTTERASVDSSGGQADDWSGIASISADGRFVAFASQATNLVPGDTNGVRDIFVHDRRVGTTTRVTVSSSGAEANHGTYFSSISGDGRFVAFQTHASNLVLSDTNGSEDVFVHDLRTRTTERVSVDSAGHQAAPSANSFSGPAISADGRCVAFVSFATNLVAGDTNNTNDVFVHDRWSGRTERASVSSTGREANGPSSSLMWPAISADGRFVAFTSYATNLVQGVTNGRSDVYVHDRSDGETLRASLGAAGVQGNSWTTALGGPAISADGRFVAFDSLATNLVPDDTNAEVDVFVRDLEGGPVFTSLCDPGVGGVIACPCSNTPGGPDRGCDNSSTTGGARLVASGGAFLSSDTLQFTTSDEKPTALSLLTQWTGTNAAGAIFGMGVRCTSGSFERLYTRSAVGGSITVPDFGAADAQVSVRSAALGDVIQVGESRWYLVVYRDPIVLGGCPASSTFNATQTGRVTWSP